MAAKFTEEDDRMLLKMRGECKYSIDDVAQALGRSKSAIQRRAINLCHGKPWTGSPTGGNRPKPVPFTPAEDAILIECRKKGMLWSDTCRALVRFSEHQARNRFRVLTETGAMDRPGIWMPEEDEKLLRLADEGKLTGAEIAAALAPRSAWAVKQRLVVLRGRRKSLVAPKAGGPTAPAIRKCIGWYCGREFLSPHAGVRFCPQCRREPKYEMTCREAGV